MSEPFRVDRRTYADAELLSRERERIFERCSLYAAHASELAAAGSFVTRTVAGNPLLIVRGPDGRLEGYRDFLFVAWIDTVATTIRTWDPVAVDRMNVTAWALAPQGQHPDDRAATLAGFLTFFGPGGFATPDDIAVIEDRQRGLPTPGTRTCRAGRAHRLRRSTTNCRCARSGSAGRS